MIYVFANYFHLHNVGSFFITDFILSPKRVNDIANTDCVFNNLNRAVSLTKCILLSKRV